jgi:hypothetical protein
MSANTILDELRVRLASGYVRQNFESGEPWSMTIASAIVDARAKALEEAAKVAETCTFQGGFQTRGDERRAFDIARRIRALQSEATP